MKNIIPFKKDIIFKTNLSEITSISLENTLKMIDDVVTGDFIISGDYKINDSSNTVTPFNIEIPFKSTMDERFVTNKAIIDIDDFYYEIVNDNVLSVSIDVLVDKLEEKPLIELEEVEEKEENRESDIEIKDKITSIFNTDNNLDDVYVTYNVFIVREDFSIEKVLETYDITKEELEKYNDLSEIKLGDKLLIPSGNKEN